MIGFQGIEKLTCDNTTLDITIKDFWSWAYSDLYNTVNRGKFGEFIVATAIGAENANDLTDINFNAFDLLYKGKYRIEVKTSAMIKSNRMPIPSFSIAKASLADENGNYIDGAPKQRNSDIYVFCVFKADDEEQDPLDLDNWEFYVVATKTIDEMLGDQKTVRFTRLLELPVIKCRYDGIQNSIDKLIKKI